MADNEIRGSISSQVPDVSGRVESWRGPQGLSAYEVAVSEGYVGTETEWLASLVGEPGYTPVKGVDYDDGEKGDPGYSPTVVINDITGGHQVVVTDKVGDHSFNVMDGQDGSTPAITSNKSGTITTIYADGTAIATINDGTDGHDGHTPVRGTDYWTSEDQAAIVSDVLDALPAAEEVSY